MTAPRGKKQVRFEVVEDDGIPLFADNEWMRELKSKEKKLKESELRDMVVLRHFGFDPAGFSKGGNATCPFCGTVAESDYVKAEGCAGRMSHQMMAIVCTRPGKQGKVYLSADDFFDFVPNDDALSTRTEKLCKDTGLTVPNEPIITDAKNCCWVLLYGLTRFSELFLPRQLLSLMTFAAALRRKPSEAKTIDAEQWNAIVSSLACWVDRLTDFNSTMCTLKPGGERGVVHSFTRPVIPLVWDFAEANPLGTDSANAADMLDYLVAAIEAAHSSRRPAKAMRGSATAIPLPDSSVDAIITDPPYYDNVPYAAVSDFFYVWFKRTVGDLYREHFATEGTPKKSEIVADAVRHGDDRHKAEKSYEDMMARAFGEAHRVLKSDGQMTVVYAHKTTLGWATLVDALRGVGFSVTEAWPLDTEMRTRLRGMESAALASSIFLVARKREGAETGNFEEAVKPELEQIVRERVETLWEMGISGADLVIASVGAGLCAFTRFARVEYANGEEVPAERFLSEVETVVLETILKRLSKEVGSRDGYGLAGVDSATRFYLLWRYTYRSAELESGEAIIFANGTHVELDGPNGLSSGGRALVEKKKGKYRLLDYTERGDDEKLGLPNGDGQPVPMVDALHRTLWLMENRPAQLAEFLQGAQPNREQMRLVAQALAGPALKGGELADVSPSDEMAALGKLTANWRSVIEDQTLPLFR